MFRFLKKTQRGLVHRCKKRCKIFVRRAVYVVAAWIIFVVVLVLLREHDAAAHAVEFIIGGLSGSASDARIEGGA